MTLRVRPATVATAVVAGALACWIVAVRSMTGMDMGPGSALGSFPFFLGVWVTMMAAMMLPAALPMVLLFDRVRREHRARGRAAAPTSVFVASYLAVWAVAGVAAYAADRALRSWAPHLLSWQHAGPYVAGAAVAGAGLYELTPLKRVCLGHCRGPLHYLLDGWRHGLRGALRMGIGHAGYCIGCCWALMVVLFAVGVMSVFWMAVVAAVIFVEKLLPRGERLPLLVGAALVALGVWVAVAPGSVPHLTQPGGAMQQTGMR